MRAPVHARARIGLGHHQRLGLGGVWFDALRPLIRTLEREILIDDEVRNRLSRLAPAPAPASRSAEAAATAKRDLAERREMAAELTDLAGQVIDGEALRRFLRERLAPYKIPAEVVSMPRLPATGTGKLAKAQLKAMAAERTR